MIATMERIEIVFLRSELNAMVKFLQEQGVVHLEQTPLAVENHPGYLHRVHLPKDEKAEVARLSELDSMLKQVLPLLSVKPSYFDVVAQGRQYGSTLPEGAAEDIRAWYRELRRITRRRLNVQDDITLIQQYSASLREFLPLLQETGAKLGDNARALLLDSFTQEGIDALRKKLDEAAGGNARFATRKLGRDRVALVVAFASEKGEAVDAVLAAEGIRALSSPDEEIYGDSAQSVLAKTGAKLQKLQTNLNALTDAIREFSAQHGAQLMALSQLVANRLKQLTATENFAQSKLVGVVHGWIPADEYDKLASALQSTFGNRAAIDKLGFHDVELHRVPTKRVNHPLIKPYELVMGLQKPPSYGHFDPTALVGISFTIFFGFVVGDMGYASVILLLAWWARRKFGHIEVARDGIQILTYMGLSTLAFGFFYWELFGNVLERFIPFPGAPFFHRSHDTSTLLAISVMFGLIHIPLSLIIGVREGFAHGHTKHAEEKLGMLLGLFSLLIAIVAMGGYFPLGGMLGGVLALGLFGAALFYLFKSMKGMAPMGVMEIIGLTANILSYSRLMALGIAGIAFADIANRMSQGAVGFNLVFFIGILVAFAVHAFNLGLSVFSPTIHSVRLNFVEFLPKFYDPAGRNYEPFRKDMAW